MKNYNYEDVVWWDNSVSLSEPILLFFLIMFTAVIIAAIFNKD